MTRAASTSDAIPSRVCTNTAVRGEEGRLCGKTYERFYKCCPFCGFYPVPPERSAPEFVDGDLFELDAETLAALRGKVRDIMVVPWATGQYASANMAQARDANAAQFYLREAMALWAGWQRHMGWTDAETYKLFYLTFGRIDVLSAQALGKADAEALTLRIKAKLDQHGVTAA